MDLSVSVLSSIVKVLEKQSIKYVVVGSFASSIHGRYRATADIDLLVDITSDQVRPLFESLKDEFYVDEHAMRQAQLRSGSFNAIPFEQVFKIVFFIAGKDSFAMSQLSRRELKQLPALSEQDLYVATAEDTILAKLKWFRAGQGVSDSQWRDVLGIVKTSGKKLDQSYLENWAETLGLSDLLAELFLEAKPED